MKKASITTKPPLSTSAVRTGKGWPVCFQVALERSVSGLSPLVSATLPIVQSVLSLGSASRLCCYYTGEFASIAASQRAS